MAHTWLSHGKLNRVTLPRISVFFLSLSYKGGEEEGWEKNRNSYIVLLCHAFLYLNGYTLEQMTLDFLVRPP